MVHIIQSNGDNIISAIKTILVTVMATVLSYFEPVQNAWLVLILMSGIDIFFGIISSVNVQKEKFCFKKFILAAVYLGIYIGIIATVYVIGWAMGDVPAALLGVKIITYAFIYFYAVNILKNLRALFPANQGLKFTEYMLCMEFTKKIPALNNYLEKKNETKA